MLDYGWIDIDVSKEVDVNKSYGSRKCIICHYWYFLEINFKFQSKLWDSCHHLMQEAMGFNDVAIVFVERNEYRIPFWYVRKDEATMLLRNAGLRKKSWTL